RVFMTRTNQLRLWESDVIAAVIRNPEANSLSQKDVPLFKDLQTQVNLPRLVKWTGLHVGESERRERFDGCLAGAWNSLKAKRACLPPPEPCFGMSHTRTR